MPLEIKGCYIRERKASPSKFRKGSLRTVVAGKHRIIVGCPKGSGKFRGRCPTGTRVQSILHPLCERSRFAKKLRRMKA